MRWIATLFLVCCCLVLGWGQLSITSTGTFIIDFKSTVSGVNEGEFQGNGFSPSPASGQLDSDAWIATGLSDGSLTFGGTETTSNTDFTRGTDPNAVGTGGIYAFEVGSNDFALGVQPIADDFTPGTLELRVQNNTGNILNSVDISYTLYIYNDQERANSFNFSYNPDGSGEIAVSSLNETSAEMSATTPSWVPFMKSTNINSLNIPDGGFLDLIWTGNDVSGSGSRDQFALDNISISNASPLPITLQNFTATPTSNTTHLHWRTATELNNDYMAVEHSSDGRRYTEIGQVLGAGTTQEPQDYSFVHEAPAPGINYYRLRQVDYDGQYEYHGPVTARFGNGSSVLDIFPTATADELTVSYEGQLDTDATLSIQSTSGRTLREWAWDSKSSRRTSFDVADLPAGWYVLRLRNGREVVAGRFLKQ